MSYYLGKCAVRLYLLGATLVSNASTSPDLIVCSPNDNLYVGLKTLDK